MSSKPLVSLIVGGRNDSYMGDFKWRFSAAINFLCQSLKDIGRLGDLELVVCDWNSDVPLHTVLRLCPEAKEVVRFVVVPPEVAQPILREKECEFPIPIVQNIAIRRSRGQYIGQTDSDVLYTTATLLSLFNALEGRVPHVPFDRAFLTGGRRHLPLQQILSQPSYISLRDYVLRNGFLFRPEQPQAGSAAPTSLVMMHRDIWHECQGYDERWVHWGWMDLDLALRVTQRYPIVHLDNFGLNLIHLEHYVVRDYDPKKHFRRTNRSDDNPEYVANDRSWGLAELNFEEHEAELVDAECCTRDAPPSDFSAPIPVESIAAELEDTNLRDAVKTVVEGAGVPMAPNDYSALLLLGWCAIKLRPRVYVESEMRYAHAAALMSRICPGVEVFGLVDWRRNQADEQLFARREDACLTFWASNLLNGFGNLKSYSRFIGGSPGTTVQRLQDSTPPSFQWNVALVRCGGQAINRAAELCRTAGNPSAMVLTGSDPAAVSASVASVSATNTPHRTVNTSDGLSTMLLFP